MTYYCGFKGLFDINESNSKIKFDVFVSHNIFSYLSQCLILGIMFSYLVFV